MKKLCLISLAVFFLTVSANLSAFELSFRNGPAIDAKNWTIDGTQYKLGLNLASTEKGNASGFYSSTSIDLALLKDSTVVWLTPEFQFDIKLGGLPLYIYPKFGLDMFFAWLPGGYKAFGFGIKPAFGAKFDLFKNLFIWAEPFGLNIIFAQYAWGGVSVPGLPSFVNGGWIKKTVMSYDLMFGIGIRI